MGSEMCIRDSTSRDARRAATQQSDKLASSEEVEELMRDAVEFQIRVNGQTYATLVSIRKAFLGHQRKTEILTVLGGSQYVDSSLVERWLKLPAQARRFMLDGTGFTGVVRRRDPPTATDVPEPCTSETPQADESQLFVVEAKELLRTKGGSRVLALFCDELCKIHPEAKMAIEQAGGREAWACLAGLHLEHHDANNPSNCILHLTSPTLQGIQESQQNQAIGDYMQQVITDLVRRAGGSLHINRIQSRFSQDSRSKEIAAALPGRQICLASHQRWLQAPAQAAIFTVTGTSFFSQVSMRSRTPTDEHAESDTASAVSELPGLETSFEAEAKMLLRRQGGSDSLAHFCSALYQIHPAAKMAIKQAGGAKPWARLVGLHLEYPDGGDSGKCILYIAPPASKLSLIHI